MLHKGQFSLKILVQYFFILLGLDMLNFFFYNFKAKIDPLYEKPKNRPLNLISLSRMR